MSIDNVQDLSPRAQYSAAAAQTVFDYEFPIFVDSDLVVYVDDDLQALSTDYTVSGAGADNGGTITFTVGRSAGEIITIYRDIAIERTTDFQQNGPNLSSAMNDELDRVTLVMQQLEALIGRCIRWPQTAETPSSGLELSPLSNWLSKYLYVSAAGNLEPATSVATTTLSQSVIGSLLFPQTSAESAAGITPTRYYYPEGNVLRYGADASGAADSYAAFNAAALVGAQQQNDGYVVEIPPGTFKLLTRVVAAGRILFRGSGMNSTRINLGTGVSGFRFVNAVPTTEIEGGGITDCSISHDTCAIVIEVENVWGTQFERLFLRDGGSGSTRLFKISGESFETRINGCRLLGGATYGIDIISFANSCIIEDNDLALNNGCTAIRVQDAGDVAIVHNRFEYAGAATGTKIEVDNSPTVVIRDNDITQGTSGYAIVLKNGSADGAVIAGNGFSTSGSAGCIDIQNGDYGSISDNYFDIGSTTGDQIKAGGRFGWTVSNNRFNVNAALATAANLILVNTSATYWSITGNQFIGAGSGSGQGTAIQIDAGSASISIIGNGFHSLNTGIDTQANNASPSVVIESNTFSGLTTKITVGTASSNLIRNNTGYRTQNTGTATIASGTTAITVTHGLDITPNAGRITITPTANTTTDPGNIWVSAIGATTFDVNCRTNPGAGGMAFAWGAEGL